MKRNAKPVGHPRQGVPRVRLSKFERLLDEIKDEIDQLSDLKSDKRCREGAKDLIEYIELHYLHRGES